MVVVLDRMPFNEWHLYIREELKRMYMEGNPAVANQSNEEAQIEEARLQRGLVINAKRILRNGK